MSSNSCVCPAMSDVLKGTLEKVQWLLCSAASPRSSASDAPGDSEPFCVRDELRQLRPLILRTHPPRNIHLASEKKVLLAPSGPLWGESALSLVFAVVLVTDVLLQLDHVSGTTYLPVCETRKLAAQNSEDNWKHSCFRRTAVHRDFLIIALYKYSYLLTYLLLLLLTA